MANLMTQGKLQQLRGRFKETWGNITDDDIARAGGSKDKLVGIIKEKTGMAEQEIRRHLEGGSSDSGSQEMR